MQRFQTIPVLMLTALLGLSGTVIASTGGDGHDVASTATTTADAAQDPRQLVQQTAEQVMARLQRERSELKAHPERIYELVKDLILPHFDFDGMSRWVLGRHWQQATPAQRQQFETQFRDLMVRTYSSALLRYDSEHIEYLSGHDLGKSNQALVRTLIRQSDQVSIPVDYRLYMDKSQQWKVFDMSIDGVSLITNYRRSFAEQIRRVGLNGLIDRLVQHNQANAS